jgi:anti-sigma B factor antagonist
MRKKTEMTITEQVRGDVIVLGLKGRFMGEPEATLFHQKKYRLLEAKSIRIVLDLSGIAMINSSGLGSLIAALVTIRDRGGDLRLAALSESVDFVIHKVKLDKVFKVFRTVEEAISSFS